MMTVFLTMMLIWEDLIIYHSIFDEMEIEKRRKKMTMKEVMNDKNYIFVITTNH